MQPFFLLLWLMCNFKAVECAEVVDDVEFVQLLWRHGDRAQIASYPNDKYDESIWSQGYGSLTNKGIEQHYRLGHFFRQRYSALLSAEYKENEVSIRSTSIPRALRSVAANAAAFFRASASSETWDSSLTSAKNDTAYLGNLWQPVPIQTVPIENDQLMALAPCEAASRLLQPLEDGTAPALAKILNTHKELFKFIGRKAYNQDSLNCSAACHLEDVLYTQRQHGFKTDWVNDTIVKVLDELSAAKFHAISYSDALVRLSGGGLLNQMVENMKQKRNATAHPDMKTRKLMIYSGHDTTVAGLLGALGVLNYTQGRINYTSTVIIEMLKDQTIRVLFKSDSSSFSNILDVEPTDLTSHICNKQCTLSNFIKSVSPRMTNDWARECNAKAPEPASSGVAWKVFLSITIIGAVGILLYMYIYKKWRRGRHDQELAGLAWDEDL